jgi:hypothetical protein
VALVGNACLLIGWSFQFITGFKSRKICCVASHFDHNASVPSQANAPLVLRVKDGRKRVYKTTTRDNFVPNKTLITLFCVTP